MRNTKIVCTLGPAVDNDEAMESLILAGLNAARYNFSHGDHEEQGGRLARFRRLAAKHGLILPCILDTKGPEIRIGSFEEPIYVNPGDKFTLTTREITGNQEIVTIAHKGLPQDVQIGTKILIDDGLVELEVESIEDTEVHCVVLNAGKIGNKKGVNIPNTSVSLPPLTEKDISDLKFGCENNYDYIAASFIRKKEDVLTIRKYLDDFGGKDVKIISKIENQEGLDNFDEILAVSDGIMVARGDLGIEIPVEKLPAVQKMMIKKTTAAGKFVITATQMLDSMIKNPRPTRAEVTDVANAILDGTSAVMLSGESANGDYPSEAVKVMAKIAEETEKTMDRSEPTNKLTNVKDANLEDKDIYRECINYTVCTSANVLQAKAIICVSQNGKSPRVLSKFRPSCPIFVITPVEKTAKQLSVEWGVKTCLIEGTENFDELLNKGIEEFKKQGLLEKGDTVILSGGATHDAEAEHKQMLGGILKI